MNFWADPGRLSALALLSGWTAIDTTEAVQLMVCQPLPAGLMAGWLTGQPQLGLFVGGALQLLWSRLAPVGAAAYPDVGPATVAGVAAGSAILPAASAGASWSGELLPGPEGVPAILLAVLVALVVARANQELVVFQRHWNRVLAARADSAALRNDFGGVERSNAFGLLGGFLRGMITVPAGLALGGLLRLAADRTAGFRPGLGLASGMAVGIPNPGPALLWAFGLAALGVTLMRARRFDWLLLAGGIAAGLATGLAR